MFSKKTLTPGWAEFRIIMPRTLLDIPDYEVHDEDARFKIAKFMLATVSGIASAHGNSKLKKLCETFASRLGML
jgi:hypothetical protein